MLAVYMHVCQVQPCEPEVNLHATADLIRLADGTYACNRCCCSLGTHLPSVCNQCPVWLSACSSLDPQLSSETQVVRPKEGKVPYRYLTIQALHNGHHDQFQCAEFHTSEIPAAHSMDIQAYFR